MALQFNFDLELVLLALALVGLVVLGIVVIVRARRWRSAAEEAPPLRIEHYRALLEQGILSPEEFQRIRDFLEKRAAGGVGEPQAPVTAPLDSSTITPAEPLPMPDSRVRE